MSDTQDIVVDQFKNALVGDTIVQWWDVKRDARRLEGLVTKVKLLKGPRGGIKDGSKVVVKWEDKNTPMEYLISSGHIMPRLRREGEVLE